MKNKRKKILLVINTQTYFKNLLSLGIMLKETKKYDPLLYFLIDYQDINNDLIVCEKEKITYIKSFKNSNKNNVLSSYNTAEAHTIKQRIREILVYVYSIFFIGFIYELVNCITLIRTTGKTIRKEKPDLIVFGGDNIDIEVPIVVKISKQENIPTVMFPQWMIKVEDSGENYYYNKLHFYGNLSNTIIGRLFPNWVYLHKDRKLLRWPGFKILVIKLFGLEPPLPWVLHSGYVDKIVVESEMLYRHMVEDGLEPQKIIVLGSLVNDKLAAASKDKKRKIYKDLNISTDKQIILSALPPNQLLGFGREVCDFENYQDLVKFWIKTLTAFSNFNIVISLHPATNYEEVKYIQEMGAKIYKGDIVDVIPYCTIFVASVSTTMQWAIACGIPIINYDVFKYGYTPYNDIRGIIGTTKREEYYPILQKIISDSKYYKKVKTFQEKEKVKWGILDGKSKERIVSLINSLI